MGVYEDKATGNFYSTGPEYDQPICQADGGDGSFFGVFSKTTIHHQHKCGRVDGHDGNHLCDGQHCIHQWE